MPNKNYIRGYATERKAFKELEEVGYYPIRASGSHTLFDIVALPTTKLKGRLLQEFPVLALQLKRVKGKYYSFKKEIEQMKKVPLITTINSTEVMVRKELWIWLDRIKGYRKAGWIKKAIDLTTLTK